VLRLDNMHRMNSPGKAEGNWTWRLPASFRWSSLSKDAAELRSLAVMYDRAPPPVAGAAEEAWDAKLSGATDPLEEYCATAPDADECRIYED
jgi:CP12 domain